MLRPHLRDSCRLELSVVVTLNQIFLRFSFQLVGTLFTVEKTVWTVIRHVDYTGRRPYRKPVVRRSTSRRKSSPVARYLTEFVAHKANVLQINAISRVSTACLQPESDNCNSANTAEAQAGNIRSERNYSRSGTSGTAVRIPKGWRRRYKPIADIRRHDDVARIDRQDHAIRLDAMYHNSWSALVGYDSIPGIVRDRRRKVDA